VSLKLITAPAVEPVSLAEAKLQCRVDIGDDDALITGLIKAARESAETITRRALITQTWELVLDEFPEGDEIIVPLPPLVSITSIKYKDGDGVESTFAAANYIVNTDAEPGKVVLADGASWPSTSLYPTAAIRVRFVAGYGAAGSSAPASILAAIKLMVGHWYENRENSLPGGAEVQLLPMGVDALLWPYRMLSFP